MRGAIQKGLLRFLGGIGDGNNIYDFIIEMRVSESILLSISSPIIILRSSIYIETLMCFCASGFFVKMP